MTRQYRVEAGNFTVVLPGTWASVPMSSDAELERSVAALVKRQVGRDDRLATARRDAKQQLIEIARSARAAGAFSLALSLEIMPGIPFPGSIIFDFVGWPGASDDLAEQLRSRFPAGELLELQAGLTIRTSALETLRVGDEEAPELKLQYFTPAPDRERMLRATVNLPTVAHPELYTELFDAIIDSIRWYAIYEPTDDEPTAAEKEN
ncbi:hypothetical protein [Diaminobutyricimonas sp. LJ205]|uniref:hypothetical protein n=1 Tax=Diaminobutyricimonas sp. LJ205 TaxID=2683590 RepID=UPI0012F4E84A|nr:hypothetical protein [Diaminobutyricimonas sp. LJ205]